MHGQENEMFEWSREKKVKIDLTRYIVRIYACTLVFIVPNVVDHICLSSATTAARGDPVFRLENLSEVFRGWYVMDVAY